MPLDPLESQPHLISDLSSVPDSARTTGGLFKVVQEHESDTVRLLTRKLSYMWRWPHQHRSHQARLRGHLCRHRGSIGKLFNYYHRSDRALLMRTGPLHQTPHLCRSHVLLHYPLIIKLHTQLELDSIIPHLRSRSHRWVRLLPRLLTNLPIRPQPILSETPNRSWDASFSQLYMSTSISHAALNIALLLCMCWIALEMPCTIQSKAG